MEQKIKHGLAGAAGLWMSIFLSAIFPMMLGFVLSESFSDWRWSHYPFHSMVESVGALSALIIATLMVIMLKNGHLFRHYIMVACGLIGMGLLDGFHAVMHVGGSFVWLHSIATMVGGIMFASVWFPEAWLTEKRQQLLLLTTVTVSLLAGIVSIALPDILPIMVVDGEFSLLAKIINITGGIGFLIGTSYFIFDFLQAKKTLSVERGQTEDMVFANHCLLFGIAGLLFETSVLWDAGWWWWHILRLLAYLVVLVYFFVLFKRGQNQLTTSEERFRLINSRVPAIVYQFKVDAKGERSMPYVNPMIEKYLGLSPQVVMNDVENWFALTHPDDLPGLEASIVVSMENMTLWDWEGRFISNDDGVRYLHGTSTPVRQQDGSVLWNGVFIDMTDQRKAEMEVERNKARFEAMFESIPDAIIFADPDRNIQMVNSAAIQMFGYESSEFKGNQSSMLYASPEDFKQQGEKRFNKSGGSLSTPYEITYKQKNDMEFKGETLGTRVKSSTGEVLGYLGIIRDVSERRQIESMFQSLAAGTSALQFESFLSDALKHLTTVYDCPYALVGQLQPDRQHVKTLSVRVNGQAVDNFEYSLEGTPCKDIIDGKQNLIPRDASKIYADNHMLADMGVESYFGAPLIKSDGSIVGVLYVMNTRHMEIDEWTESVLGVFATRISLELERELATQELRLHREHLEELVQKRTTDLSAARDEAERANASKSEFLSRMSHELRTPMNAILGFGQILEMKSEGLDDIQRSNIQEILVAGRHLLDLINDVLDMARIESGKMEVSMEAVHVDEVLQQSLALEQSLAKERQIEIIDNISNKGYVVQADFTRLKQVLVNLLSNAVKYNSEHGRITLDSQVIDKQRLRICVTDSGKGLTEEEITKLFTSFERLDAVNNVEGTGIGLVITQHLTKLMGGIIDVESTPGEGSTFWVELALSNDL